jgi:hypothetical protein
VNQARGYRESSTRRNFGKIQVSLVFSGTSTSENCLRTCEMCKIDTYTCHIHTYILKITQVFNTRTNTTEDEAYVIPTEYAVVDARDKMQEILEREHGKVARAVSTERIIILTVKSPHVPSIDLIDMPGFVSTPEDMKTKTRQLIESHISKHGQYSLFLATGRAIVAPNMSVAMEIVQDKQLQDRTIGVFTMCDHAMALRDFPRPFLERLNVSPRDDSGAVALEPHGWVCVMDAQEGNETEESERSNFARLKQQALAEEACMSAKMASAMKDSNAACGCRALIDEINTQFMQFLKESWGPKTVKLLCNALEDTSKENSALGLPAFRVEGIEHAIKAREGAVAEANRLLERECEEPVQSFCTQVLKPWKDKFIKITTQGMVDLSPLMLIQEVKGAKRGTRGNLQRGYLQVGSVLDFSRESGLTGTHSDSVASIWLQPWAFPFVPVKDTSIGCTDVAACKRKDQQGSSDID